MTLTPAYGRDYVSKKAILVDWHAGKDFVLHSHNGTTYINRADAEKAGFACFTVRYKSLRSVASITRNGKTGEWK